MLDLNPNTLRFYGLVDCYLSDHEHPEGILWDYHIYVLLKPGKFTKDFEEYCEELQCHHLYQDDYDPKQGEVMYVFKIIDTYAKDISHFKKGEYSRINKDYADNAFTPTDFRYKVIYKDKKLRKYLEGKWDIDIPPENEFWSKPLPSEEIYRYNPTIKVGWGED